MDSLPMIRYLIAGQIRREYVVSPRGLAKSDFPGGNILYSAAGLSLWDGPVGLISKIGNDFPKDDLQVIQSHGFDIKGIQISDSPLDLRLFKGYADNTNQANNNNPVSYYAALQIEFPKSLLGYSNDYDEIINQPGKITPYTISINQVPEFYWEASAIHICPIDYQSHQFLMSAVRQAHINHVTVDISSQILSPIYWDEVPGMIEGASALITTDDKLLNLFQGRSKDLWEIAEILAMHDCPLVVIKRGMEGQYIYDHHSKKRWAVPAYPSSSADPTGAGDSYNGGFLAGLRTTYDPVESALQGNISASLTVEGIGPFFALDSLPGLAKARLENLRSMVRSL